MTLRCHHCGTASPAGHPLPGLRLAADPVPRRRHAAGGGGGSGRLPAPSGRPPRSGRRGAQGGRRARPRRLRRRPARRARRDEPRGEGPRHPGGDARRRRLGRHRPQPARRARRRADVPAADPGSRAGPGAGERPGLAIIQTYQPEHPAIQAVATGDASAFYDAELEVRRRFGSPPFGRLVKLTVGLADPAAAEHEAHAMADRLTPRARCRQLRPVFVSPSSVRRRPTSPDAPAGGAGTSCSAATAPLELLDGAPGAPWSVDVDPDSLL